MNKYLLHTFVEKYSAENTHKIAITHSETNVTFGQLNAASNQVANYLLDNGLQKGEYVGALMPNSIEYIICLFGIMKAGGVVVPLDASYPSSRIESCLRVVNPTTTFVTNENVAKLSEIQKNVCNTVVITYQDEALHLLNEDSTQLNAENKENPDLSLDGEESCYLLFTSGSTGVPKGIEGIHKSLSHFIHWETNTLSFDSNSRVSQLTSISFDVSLRDIFAPILVGGTICIPDSSSKYEPINFLKWIEAQNITHIHCVPSYFRLLIATVQNDKNLLSCLSSVRMILLAGEPLYGKDVNNWYEQVGDGIQLVNLYGPSETTLAKLYHLIPSKEFTPNEIIPLGKPINNTSVLILEDDQMCTEGQKGEILIKTPFRTKGYINNTKLNDEKFIQNPLHTDFRDIVFRTGDIGSFALDGSIQFHGRLDSMVKYNGNRIELNEIENIALKVEGIEVAIASIQETSEDNAILILFYKSNAEKENLLKQQYNASLPTYMHPAIFVQVEDFSKLPNGKINRNELDKIPIPIKSQGEEIEDPLELEVAELWKDLLGIDNVTRDQSFFQIGGTSLKAIQMISRIFKIKNVLLNLEEILKQPTVEGIANLIVGPVSPEEKVYQSENSGLGLDTSFTKRQLSGWIKNQQQFQDFNMAYTYDIIGALNRDELVKAVQTITEGYAFFLTKENGDSLYFSEKDVIDMSNSSNSEVQNYIHNLSNSAQEGIRPIKFKLIILNPNKHVFILLTHLTMLDGASVQIILNEIQNAYWSLTRGKEYVIKEDIISSKDLSPEVFPLRSDYLESLRGRFRSSGNQLIKDKNSEFDSKNLLYKEVRFSQELVETIKGFAYSMNTSVHIVLVSMFEKALQKSIRSKNMVYHNVMSSRNKYVEKVLGNLLYFIPFETENVATIEERVRKVESKLFKTLELLPIQEEINSPRPDIVLNIVDQRNEKVAPYTEDIDLVISHSKYTTVIGRFPFSMTITINSNEIIMHTSYIEELDTMHRDFTKSMTNLIKKIGIKLIK